jgi:hypothetical protein
LNVASCTSFIVLTPLLFVSSTSLICISQLPLLYPSRTSLLSIRCFPHVFTYILHVFPGFRISFSYFSHIS